MSVNLVNGDTLDSDFTTLANHIRAKTGGSSPLVYTVGDISEFTDAIDSISGGGVSWTNTKCLTVTEYANLATKDSNTLYQVTDDERFILLRMYVGTTLVFPNSTSISGYDFYAENVYFNDINSNQGGAKFAELFTTANIGRSWQIDMNISNVSTSASERVVLGTSSTSGSRLELMIYQNVLRIFGNTPSISGDRNIGEYFDTDITMSYDATNGTLDFYDDTQTLIKSFAWQASTANDNQVGTLGFFYGTSRYYGRGLIINKIGFKWLS